MLTTFIKKSLAIVLSFTTLLGGVPAWAMSTEDFIMDSWKGRPQEELLNTWGKPSSSQIIPGSNTHWIEYSSQVSSYVPPTTYTNTTGSLNAYTSPYGNTSGSFSNSSVTNTTGGYYNNYNCTVSFEVDSATYKILKWSYVGNRCEQWYVYPAHISKPVLNELKSRKKEVVAFQEKMDKSQRKVMKLRKDTNAYKVGLRNNDIIIKSETINNDTKVEIQRKKHFFTKQLITNTYLFAPTYHSEAYELLTKKQRKLFKVDDLDLVQALPTSQSGLGIEKTPTIKSIPSSTRVFITFSNTINSLGLTSGSALNGEVLSDVAFQGKKLISKGTSVRLNLSEVRQARGHDTDGYMVIDGGSTTDVNGEKINLALTQVAGTEKATPKLGCVLLSTLGVIVILVPAGYFIKGKPAQFPAGMIIEANVI
jgi:hypothetical protein